MKQRYFRPLVVAVFLMTVLCSAGLDKIYVQAHGESGWVFHLLSRKLPAERGGRHPSSIDYDYTYAEQSDSVAFLCTIRLSGTERIEELRILGPDATVLDHTPPELIFARSWKKGIAYRLRTSLPFSQWEQMYDAPAPFTVVFRVAQPGKEDRSCRFSYSGKKWERHRAQVAAVIDIIQLNTGKNEKKP